jgi:nucleoid-associated protein YgaU
MFEQPLDIEQAFGDDGRMSRTRVRRRRITLTGACVLVTAIMAGPVAGAVGGPGVAPVARHTYVVRAGDSLWSIATRMAPGQDPRPWVVRLREANPAADAAALTPGQTLMLPGAGG